MVEPTAIEQDARTAEAASLQENRSFQPSHPFSEYAGSAATNQQRYNGTEVASKMPDIRSMLPMSFYIRKPCI